MIANNVYSEAMVFLNIKNGGNNSACIRNPRYGTSDIIVSKNHNWQDVFSIAYEIGHAYYNSFLKG